MEVTWNLWHGCTKYSEGCKHCYVYRGDAKYNRNSSDVKKTKNFNLPIAKNRKGDYKYPPKTFFWLCFTSDFLLEDADSWREDAWDIIRLRSDCHFLFITKRITRFMQCIPSDWGDGWDNVTIVCTCENQKRANERLPVFLSLPIKHKCIASEPLLEEINLSPYLNESIEQVIVGGESGYYARPCKYDWILKIRKDCIDKNVNFHFKQTGTHFIKDSKMFTVERKLQHSQARKANINYIANKKGYLK